LWRARVALPDSRRQWQRGSNHDSKSVYAIVSTSVYQRLLSISDERGAGFVVLVDPDKLAVEDMPRFADYCLGAGVDALFVGGSLCQAHDLDGYVSSLRAARSCPVIAFPGSITQIAPLVRRDAVPVDRLGRNPEYLFGQHVHAAPIIKRSRASRPIPTGYMLIESGRPTTAQYMSGSLPIPHHKPDIAAATGLAAEMMGMKPAVHRRRLGRR
jgi:heptaprenylglyceryl phosphate synthase